MSIAGESSHDTGQMQLDGTMSEDAKDGERGTSDHLITTSARSISSAADSPASPSASQDNNVEKTILDTSGPSSSASFARLSRDGSWLKTSQGCCQLMLDGSSELWSETWPRAGTVCGGIAYRLRPLAPRTCGTESSYLATPTAKANQLAPSMMKHPGCRNWLPTPTTAETINSFRQVFWKGNSPRIRSNNGVAGQARIGDVIGGKPNPTWIEWLMGFPDNWTDSEPSATP